MLTSAQIDNHIQILRNDVFQVDTKWPQFELLIDDLVRLNKKLKKDSKIISLERGLLYGGFSLIAPLFHNKHEMFTMDCSPPSADKSGAYNKSLVNNKNFIKIKNSRRTSVVSLLKSHKNKYDCVIVPNLVHHVKDQESLFKLLKKLLKPSGRVYIFEALVREIHQKPDDFLRYTPYGLKFMLEKNNFSKFKINQTGDVFGVIKYCWVQAFEYFPEKDRKKIKKWFYDDHDKKLKQFSKSFKSNLLRKQSEFPEAYSIEGILK